MRTRYSQELTRISNYTLNEALPDSIFQKGKSELRIDASSDTVTVSVTTSKVVDNSQSEENEVELFEERKNDIIPYTVDEEKAYSEIDSTMTMEKAFMPTGFLTRIIDIDSGDESKKKEKKENVILKHLPPMFPILWYNRVDGAALGIKSDNKITDRLTFVAKGAYLTDRESWLYGGDVRYRFGEKKRVTTAIGFGSGTETRYRSVFYPLFINSVPVLSGRDDYFDYYRNDTVNASIGYKLNRWNISGKVSAEHHSSLSKTTDYNLRDSSIIQRENPSIDDGNLRSFEVGLTYGNTQSSYGLTGSKGIELNIEHSSKAILSSDYSFTRYELNADWNFKTFYQRRLLPNMLDIRFSAGTSGGKLPVQRFGILDGSIMGFSPFGVFKTLNGHPLEGEHHFAVFMEHNFRTIPYELIGLRFLAERGYGVIVHGAMGRTWISSERLSQLQFTPFYRNKPISEIGFSLNGLFGVGRLDFTKKLHESGYSIGFGIARMF